MIQQLTSETDSRLYWDGLVLDSDPFHKVSTQGKREVSTNILSSDVTSTTNPVTDLTFSDLEIGATYQLNFQADMTGSSSGGGSLQAIHDSNTIACVEVDAADGSTPLGQHKAGTFVKFTATATSVTFSYTDTGYDLRGDGTQNETFAQIEKIPLTNEAVIVESTDSVVSEWTSYTPTFTGLGTPSNLDFKWRRVGQNIEVMGKGTCGSTTAVNAKMTLPLGYQLDSSIVPNNYIIVGSFSSAYTTTANAEFTVIAINTTTDGVLFTLKNASLDGYNPYTANNLFSDGQPFSVEFTVPIAGWDANPKPLLAFPTVTYGQEPEYYNAILQSNFWDAATDTYNFDTSLIPLTGSNLVEWNDTTQTRLVAKDRTKLHVSISSVCDTSGDVIIYDSSGNQIARGDDQGNTAAQTVSISLILENGDYIYFRSANPEASKTGGMTILAEPIQGVTNQAAIIAQPVAIVEDRKPVTTPGGTGSTTPTARDLNTLSGDIAAVGVSLDGTDGFKFTEDCKVYIEWWAPAYKCGRSTSGLYNETKSTYLKLASAAYTSTAHSVQVISHGIWEGHVKAGDVLAINHELEDATTPSSSGLGVQQDSVQSITDGLYELYTKVKITRLK